MASVVQIAHRGVNARICISYRHDGKCNVKIVQESVATGLEDIIIPGQCMYWYSLSEIECIISLKERVYHVHEAGR